LPVGGKNPALGAEKPGTPAVLGFVENLVTLIDHWFDPVSLGIVLGGTLLATLLRCGFAESRLAAAKVAALLARPFDPAKARVEMARQIRIISDKGIHGATPVQFGDGEFDHLTDVLISRRSIDTLHAEHESYKRQRTEAAQTAMTVLGHAAELAPVLGLAGTLVALGTMPSDASEGGMTAAIAMAVVTTLYGLAAANFLFGPLSSAILRRSAREERDRQAVLDWLEQGVRTSTPHVKPVPGAGGLRIAS